MAANFRMMARLPAVDDPTLSTAAVRRAWSFARPYRWRLLANVACIFLAAGLALLPPIIFKALIDRALPHRDGALVNLLFVASLLLAFAITAANVANRWFSSSIGEGLIFDLRVALYRHLLQMPIGFFSRTQTGAVISRLNNDVVGAQATVTTATSLVSNVVTLSTTLAAMVVLSWRVTLLALCVVPLFVLLDRRVGPRLATLSRERMQVNAAMTATAQERFNVSGALLVKLFGRPDEEVQRFRSDAGAVRDLGVRMTVTSRSYYGALALAASVGTAIAYWVGGHAVIDGGMTIGTLTALAAYVTRLYDPLTSIASARTDLLTALVSFERCFEVIDAPIPITEAPGATQLAAPEGHVRFAGVGFRYPTPSSQTIASLEASPAMAVDADDAPSRWILRDIDIDIPAGTTVALVGPSGAGKSTLSSLLPRLYDVTEGAISIDGHDIRHLTLASLSAAIGVVSQDAHLFHASVAENLRYARPGATDEELREACRRARIDHVITALPDGYATVVGERGYRLSGGEKQRLAIARVLLKQPAVVVLDEATAHLDSETELLVQQALHEALAGRTALVIAHRLSTIRESDQILVLQDGHIIERGRHDELLSRSGLYASLYATQFGGDPA